MSDLRALAADLLAHPVATPPTIPEVAARAQRVRLRQHRRRWGVVVAVLVLAGSARWVAGGAHSDNVRMVDRPGTFPRPQITVPTIEAPAVDEDMPEAHRGGVATTPDIGAALPAQCSKGLNGGRTDVGVGATDINVVLGLDSISAASTDSADAWNVVSNVFREVNKTGGICGRLLRLVQKRDWFDVPDNAFAMLAGPSIGTWLDDYVRDGRLNRRPVPVIGADALRASQFASPYVFPTGISPAALTRIAVEHAYRELRARTFALVYDEKTAYGPQVASAFRSYVGSLPNASVQIVQPAGNSIDAAQFNRTCGNDRCDFVVWAMGPSATKAWLSARSVSARLRTAGLMLETSNSVQEVYDCASFAVARACDDLEVWTGFLPPSGPFLTDPAVAAYDEASNSNDKPVIQNAFLSARLLIEAMRRVGPTLTRAGLLDVLDHTSFDLGLTAPLRWGDRAPVDRAANHAARALRFDGATFVDAGTGWVSDPTPGVFPQ